MLSIPLQLRRGLGLAIAAAAMLLATAESRAQSLAPVLPPLSAPRAQFFKDHPAAWTHFLSQLPRRPAGAPVATAQPSAPAFGGAWQAVTPAPNGAELANPLLLTDGTIIAENADTPDWYKLTPDITGNYANGTWSPIASLPVINGTQYAPQYFASAVLPDGRVIIMGGEYDGGNTGVWTNQGAIYDPLADSWTPVTAPAGDSWSQIGDSQSIVLADGTFMLAACCAYPDVDALFDASTLSWTSTGAPAAAGGYQDEQGYELLPNGNVLTLDIWTNFPDGGATNAEQYVPSLGTWISAGNTPVSLVDPAACGNWEIGPAAVAPRRDGGGLRRQYRVRRPSDDGSDRDLQFHHWCLECRTRHSGGVRVGRGDELYAGRCARRCSAEWEHPVRRQLRLRQHADSFLRTDRHECHQPGGRRRVLREHLRRLLPTTSSSCRTARSCRRISAISGRSIRRRGAPTRVGPRRSPARRSPWSQAASTRSAARSSTACRRAPITATISRRRRTTRSSRSPMSHPVMSSMPGPSTTARCRSLREPPARRNSRYRNISSRGRAIWSSSPTVFRRSRPMSWSKEAPMPRRRISMATRNPTSSCAMPTGMCSCG